jgi:DME family drug/metabolite transporter
VLWGTTGTASTLAPAGAPPAAIGSAGLAAGGLLLFLTSRGARSLPAACTGAQRWLLGTVRGAAVALHLAVFTTFVAYRLFGRGLRNTPAQAAATLTLAEAAVAAVLGVVALGERLPGVSWCGLAVLSLGLAVLIVPARRRGGPGTDRPGSP